MRQSHPLTRPTSKNPNTVWKLKYSGKLFVAGVTLGPGFYLQEELPLLLGGAVACPAYAVALRDAVVGVFMEGN